MASYYSSNWIHSFPQNFQWSNAALVCKGMAPYGAVALGEIDWIVQRLPSGELKFVVYINTGHSFLPGSATVDILDGAEIRRAHAAHPSALMNRLPGVQGSGLALYWAVGNFISIAQQAIMNRTSLGREMREIAAKRARRKAGTPTTIPGRR